jgi:hypothetical protein
MVIQAHQASSVPTDTGPLADAETRTGRLVQKHFNRSELQELCADFSVKFEELEGDTSGIKAREFVSYMARRGRLGELVRRCLELRPRAQGWPIEVIEKY